MLNHFWGLHRKLLTPCVLLYRFGMSALYQLKGRVGRCAQQAHAYFYYRPDVDRFGNVNTTNARLRSLTVRPSRLVCLTLAPFFLSYICHFCCLELQEHTQLGAGLEVAKDDLRHRGCGNLEGSTSPTQIPPFFASNPTYINHYLVDFLVGGTGEEQAGKETVGHDYQAALIETALKRRLEEIGAAEEEEDEE